MLEDSSVYIHIPYCKSKCYYCNFFSLTNSRLKINEYVSLLKREINLRKDYLNNSIIKTIYFGGGTPSLLSPGDIAEILSCINSTFVIAQDPEITIEMNPDDVSDNYLHELKYRTNVNRISLGVQSLDNNELLIVNRRHDAPTAINAMNTINSYYNNLSVDIIFGLPCQTEKSLINTINIILDYHPKHVSAYALTLDENNKLINYCRKNSISLCDEDKIVDFYLLVNEKLTKNGYEQYEVSNYCLPHFESRHNVNYWILKQYLGIGCGAHSFNKKSRRWNLCSLKLYKQGKNYYEEELIDMKKSYNEYIMLSLRNKLGINLNFIKNNFEEQYFFNTIKNLQKIPAKHIISNDLNFSLNSFGLLFADLYASYFFMH